MYMYRLLYIPCNLIMICSLSFSRTNRNYGGYILLIVNVTQFSYLLRKLLDYRKRKMLAKYKTDYYYYNDIIDCTCVGTITIDGA